MADLRDAGVARAALEDPATTGAALSVIAQLHPGLRTQVATHPAAYPGLLDWLAALGDPALDAVLNARRGAARPVAGPVDSQPFAGPVFPQPLAGAAVSQPPANPMAGRPDPGLPAMPEFAPPNGVPPMVAPVGSAPQPARRRPTKLLVGVGAGALALVVAITGFLTNGFGLLASGGSATPEEAAIKVADKTAGLINSLSLRDLLNNPYAAADALTREFAPSEARLYSSFTTVDTADLLGLTDDTMTLAGDVIGSFGVRLDGLRTEVSELTDDIAQVRYVGGTVTVTADLARLRDALPELPRTAAEQVAATAEKYGLHPRPIPVDELSEDWADDLLDEIEGAFPVVVDLADYDDWLRSDQSPPDYGIASLYQSIAGVMVVREGGQWYLSPLLTSQLWSTGLPYGGNPDPLDPEIERLLAEEGAHNSSPTAAADGLAEALSRGEPRAILSQLPLAERRYAALSGILSESGQGDEIDYRFTELSRTGGQAKVRIDVFLTDDGEEGILDGSCVRTGGESYCLREFLAPGGVTDLIDQVRALDWGDFEDATGIASDDLLDRLELAATAAVESIDPDQLGLVAIEEDGSWLVSVSATASDLQNHAVNALVAGLKAAQVP